MKPYLAAFLAIFSLCALCACGTAPPPQNDGVSRFASDTAAMLPA